MSARSLFGSPSFEYDVQDDGNGTDAPFDDEYEYGPQDEHDEDHHAASSDGNPANDNHYLLQPHHEVHLRKSGWRQETWTALNVRSITDAKEIRRTLRWDPRAESLAAALGPCIVFDYGLGYMRLRPDNPRLFGSAPAKAGDVCGHNVSWQQRDDRKPIKYEAPKDAGFRAYVPIAICPDIANPKVTLFYTEGEKKAGVMAQDGVACIGLPGVNCGHDKTWLMDEGEDSLLPDFSRYAVPSREVCGLFDSPDMIRNVNVIRAAVRISRMLLEREVVALVGYVDEVPGTEKTGVDDWYVHQVANGNSKPFSNPKFARPRPVQPSELLEWLKDQAHDNGWTVKNAELKKLLLQAATWVRVWNERASRGWKAWVKTAAKAFKLQENDIEKLVTHLGIGDKEKRATEPRVFWNRWIAGHAVKFVPKQEMFTVEGQQMEAAILLSHAYLDGDLQNVSRKGLCDAFSIWLWKEKTAVFVELRKKMPHLPEVGRRELVAFVEAVTGGHDEVDIAVAAHFIWQVKRKLHGLNVHDHLMPVLVGAQRSGKSTALKKFLEPVDVLVDEAADLKVLEDERQMSRLASSLVVMFDEMSKASSTDVDALKNRVTATTVKWRVLGTNVHNVREQMATFIGASNNSLRDLIHDPTGMRRFYELRCQPKMDWDVINSIQHGLIWLGVDHQAKSPLVPYLAEVQRRQEACRSQDSVEEFLELCCLVGIHQSGRRTTWSAANDVYARYVEWMNMQKRSPLGQPRFGRRIKEVLGEEHWKESNGIKYHLSFKEHPDTWSLTRNCGALSS